MDRKQGDARERSTATATPNARLGNGSGMTTLEAAPGAASLIGRDREFDVLRDRLERADAGRGSAVLLTGEAGVGKSSLARQLVGAAAGMGARVLEGRCVAIGSEPLRCAALLELLRTAAAASPGASGTAAIDSLALAEAPTEVLLERVLSSGRCRGPGPQRCSSWWKTSTGPIGPRARC